MRITRQFTWTEKNDRWELTGNMYTIFGMITRQSQIGNLRLTKVGYVFRNYHLDLAEDTLKEVNRKVETLKENRK